MIKSSLLIGVLGLLGLMSATTARPAETEAQTEMEQPIEFTRSLIVAKEAMLLNDIDHQVFAAEARQLANRVRWSKGAAKDGSNTYLRRDDPGISPALLILRPSSIRVWDDRIDVEFGGALYYFGIRVFQEGTVGQGTKELGKGVWFYTQDNRLPETPQRDGGE